MKRSVSRILTLAAGVLIAVAAAQVARAARQEEGRAGGQRFPNVLIVTVDTLRADRLSSYGYKRPTSPNIDRLLAKGVRFTQARTVEPLTNPALSSMYTSLYPHEHGATRNGLKVREGLPSMARSLARRGYRTAAFVGNWTLKNRISGLGDHFQYYDEVFTRKRWLGLFKGEATAEDLTAGAAAWLAEHQATQQSRPFLLWVHYVEPHAPYRLQEEFAGKLGIATAGEVSRSDRYDTEVAFTDREVGRLLALVEQNPRLAESTLIVFTADHGESLGEHSDWGHGRNLHEPALRIPLGFVWPGRIAPDTVRAPALNLDVASTVLGLAGLPIPESFRGFDWTPVLRGAAPPENRLAWFQAHKGAVLTKHEAVSARRKGLLEVATLSGGRKEIFNLPDGRRRLYDLAADPGEIRNLVPHGSKASAALGTWLADVQKGLIASDRLGPAEIDPESVEQLRALGYAQ